MRARSRHLSRTRLWLLITALGATLIGSVLLATGVGPVSVPVADTGRIVLHHLLPGAVTAPADSIADQIVRQFATLSGGEKQRVYVARAIAQESRVLVLDEPTNHLDIHFQLELLDLVRGLGITTITAMHDLGLAAGHCDRIYVLDHGRVVGHGPPGDVLTTELVARIFGVRLRDWTDPETGRTHLSFDRLVTQDQPAAPHQRVAL